MKKRTIVIVISVIASILFIYLFIYFVSGVSATAPPIIEYECAGDYKQLVSKMDTFCSSRQNVKFEVTDRVGSQKHGYRTYATVTLTATHDSTLYYLEFKENTSKSNGAIVSMVGAFDVTRKIGGYNSNAKQTKEFIDEFNSRFLIPFQENQRVKFTPF